MFGVTPDIKIISFGVRRPKNSRVTPNGEEIKDEESNFLGVSVRVPPPEQGFLCVYIPPLLPPSPTPGCLGGGGGA